MTSKSLNEDSFKQYSKYCTPVILFVITLIAFLFVSYNNLANNVIISNSILDINQISQIKYEFLGEQLLGFITFILSCVVPILIAVLIGSYDNSENSNSCNVFSDKIISGSLFILFPFIANAVMYMILILGDFFADFQTVILARFLLLTTFGIALSLLTFILLTIINISLKNPIIDSLLTLAITLCIVHVFYSTPIHPLFLIAIIVFVWLALIYLGFSLSRKKQTK